MATKILLEFKVSLVSMMEPLQILLTIGVFSSVMIYSTAAPATLISPDKSVEVENIISVVTREPLAEDINITLKGETRHTLPLQEEVTTLEQFFRIYEDGTIEFKIVLSNGVAQFQKITKKLVDGKTIQVYEGYNSELLPDGNYRTSYYIANENGYRLLRRDFDTKPPVLPTYVPHVPKVSTSPR